MLTKTKLIIACLLCSGVIASGLGVGVTGTGGGITRVAPTEPASWNLTAVTTGDSQAFVVNINSGTNVDIDVDWGDTGTNNYTTTGVKSHTYTTAGTYTIKISGSFDSNTGNIRIGNDVATRGRLSATSIIGGVTGLLNFERTFYDCTDLTSIPTDLFRYNTAVSTNGFSYTFYRCTGLTSLPTDLFRYNTAVSAQGFYSTFCGCTGLTSIPTDLFRYNTAVSASGFSYTFYGCTGLTSLPTDLFRYNTAVSASGFSYTFYGCTKLQLNSTIFCASGDEDTRFLNQSPDFTSCFDIAIFSGTKGTAPALWDYDFGTGTPVTTDCFDGHSTTSVDNWADVPSAWGGD